MATIQQITRALQSIRTVGAARVAIRDAIAGVDAALRSGPRLRGDLTQSRADLLAWLSQLAGRDDALPLPDFQARSNVIIRAWVNVAGAGGEVSARNTVSLLDEIGKAAGELPTTVFKPVGEALGALGAGVGASAGGLVGGILRGLGPVMVVLLAILLWFKFFRKA
jgi:hypothetical protein